MALSSNLAKQFTFLTLLVFATTQSVVAAVYPTASVKTKIDSYLEQYVQMKDFSGVVLVVKNGKVLFNKSYGRANFETDSLIDANTRFRIGSVSKQFTAASILLLEERGRLSVQDKLARFIPDFPKGDRITLSMLLSHNAGISRDLPDVPGLLQVAHNTSELMEIIKAVPLVAEPGEATRYSNNGYRILAYLVEKVSGKLLQDFLNENFFQPLGMMDTGQDSQRDLVVNRASGYVPWIGSAGLGNAPLFDVSNDIGPGGLYSSAADLLKWDKALFGSKVLSKASVDRMISSDYGIGESKIANHRSIGHDGRLTGFTSFNDYYPDDDTYVVFLSNIESGAIASIRKDLPAILFNEPFKMPAKRPPVIKLDPRTVDSYVGRYQVAPGFILTAKNERGNLLLGTVEGLYPMIPESETKFFYPLRYAEVEFVKNAAGLVTEMKWREFGSEYVCKKVE